MSWAWRWCTPSLGLLAALSGHPVRGRQLQSLGPVRDGQPAPGVRTGPAGRLYRECPGRLAAWASRLAGDSVGGVFALGATSGLVAAPCGAPAFAAVLTFVSTTRSAVLGFLYLFVFSIGLTALLIAVGLFSGSSGGPPAGREMDPLDQAGRGSAAAGHGRVLLRQDGKRPMRDAWWRSRLSSPCVLGPGSLRGPGGRDRRRIRAPVVTVHDLDGKPVDLGQYIGKKPVFLEFWATWCELCEELLPRVRAAKAAYGDRVEFLGVNVTVNQSRDRVRRYLETA